MARIDDGFSTTIFFTQMTSGLDILWEKTVTPPGISGGGPNETTTMRNTAWRTLSPKNLLTLTPGSIVVAYDPDLMTEMSTMVNVNMQIEITFPGAEVMTFWGYVDELNFNEITEGEQPTAEITIQPTNQNDSQVETAPTVA